MPIPKAFWAQEAKEKSHKSIKNALLSAGETPHGKSNHKKAKSTPKKSHKTSSKGKMEKVMTEFHEKKLHAGSKKGPLVTNPRQAVAIAYSEKRKASKKK